MDRKKYNRLKMSIEHHMDEYYNQDALKITSKMFNILKPTEISIYSAFFDFIKVEHYFSLFIYYTCVTGETYG